jgi:hypothetical protein
MRHLRAEGNEQPIILVLIGGVRHNVSLIPISLACMGVNMVCGLLSHSHPHFVTMVVRPASRECLFPVAIAAAYTATGRGAYLHRPAASNCVYSSIFGLLLVYFWSTFGGGKRPFRSR